MLILLDLSAAFDSVDHPTLLERLHISYDINDVVLLWFSSYLLDRQQHVRVSNTHSEPSTVLFGVPQGSVLGPILFLLYTADLLRLIKRHQLQPHAYADGTQIYGFCHPLATSGLVSRVSSCVDDISCWMSSNRLLFNPSKTEVSWCSSQRRLQSLPAVPVLICSTPVTPVNSIRDLGVYIEADTSMKRHISATVRSCFGAR